MNTAFKYEALCQLENCSYSKVTREHFNAMGTHFQNLTLLQLITKQRNVENGDEAYRRGSDVETLSKIIIIIKIIIKF